jgi:hypothetical protein
LLLLYRNTFFYKLLLIITKQTEDSSPANPAEFLYGESSFLVENWMDLKFVLLLLLLKFLIKYIFYCIKVSIYLIFINFIINIITNIIIVKTLKCFIIIFLHITIIYIFFGNSIFRSFLYENY